MDYKQPFSKTAHSNYIINNSNCRKREWLPNRNIAKLAPIMWLHVSALIWPKVLMLMCGQGLQNVFKIWGGVEDDAVDRGG